MKARLPEESARVFKQLDYVITKSSIHPASEPGDECASIQNQSQT